MNWNEEYARKQVSAEEAASIVKNGDRVALGMCLEIEPVDTLSALAKRRDELKNVEIIVQSPQTDFGWFQPGWEKSFSVNLWNTFGRPAYECMNRHIATFTPELMSLKSKMDSERSSERRHIDVCIMSVSPPDEHGFCSFGNALWNKKSWLKSARKVIGEVREGLIRTCGNNFVSISEIDYFVKGTSPVKKYVAAAPPPTSKAVAQYLSTLIRDGDTIQSGWGMPLHAIIAGALDDKHGLGIHTEVIPRGTMGLAEKGIITGENKTLNRGKIIGTSIVTDDPNELKFFENNPICELHDISYTNDIKVIAAHDNFVSIGGALSMDLSGQMTTETLFGNIRWNGAGGLPEFAIGALLSKGGRFIIAFSSTAEGNNVSRIIPVMEEGTSVTLPNILVDYVITEYGIARLWGKSLRERANELISIAHPDFRSDLKKAALKMLYP